MQLYSKPSLKQIRQQLRNNATPAEKALWKLLKSSQLAGFKFRRQHSINNYIVDFYCTHRSLAIELDGEVHNNPINRENDLERDKYLMSVGVTVIRFENKLVFEQPDFVIAEILRHLV